MKKELEANIAVWATVILLALTPTFVAWANQTRVRASIGGEGMIWLVPFIIYLHMDTIRANKEIRIRRKREDEKSEL